MKLQHFATHIVQETRTYNKML